MNCLKIALVLGIVFIALLLWACSKSAISKYERDQRRFRKWLKQQEEREASTPPEDHE